MKDLRANEQYNTELLYNIHAEKMVRKCAKKTLLLTRIRITLSFLMHGCTSVALPLERESVSDGDYKITQSTKSGVPLI